MTCCVRIVASAAEVPDALWATFPSSLEGRWWYETLEASRLEGQFHFFYAIAEAAGQPVAVAPMFLADVPMDLVVPEAVMPWLRLVGRVFPGVLAQRTLFIGSPCSDEGAIGLMPGADLEAVLTALAAAQTRLAKSLGAWMLVWKDMPAPFAKAAGLIASRLGFFVTDSYPGTEIVFVSRDKEDYFRRMKPSHRQQLRKKLRRSLERTNLDQSIIKNPESSVLDEIFGLFMQTYMQAETRFEKLDRPFFEAAAASDPARFILLRDRGDGRLAAFMLVYDLGDTVINKFIGIDYERPRDWMLYFRLNDAAVDFALSRGAARLQSGQTGYRVKLELGHQLIPLVNFARHRLWPVHAVYAAVGQSIGWATLDPDLARHVEAHPDNPTALPGKWSEATTPAKGPATS